MGPSIAITYIVCSNATNIKHLKWPNTIKWTPQKNPILVGLFLNESLQFPDAFFDAWKLTVSLIFFEKRHYSNIISLLDNLVITRIFTVLS